MDLSLCNYFDFIAFTLLSLLSPIVIVTSYRISFAAEICRLSACATALLNSITAANAYPIERTIFELLCCFRYGQVRGYREKGYKIFLPRSLGFVSGCFGAGEESTFAHKTGFDGVLQFND